MKLAALLACAMLLLTSSVLAQVPSDDDKILFDSLKIGKMTVKNVRVVDSTPTYVTVFYEGGGIRLKRQDLPPELKTLYPYDEQAAADYEKQREADKEKRAADERARQEKFTRDLKASLLLQRPAVEQRIDQLQKDLRQLQKEIAPMKGKAHGKPHSPARAELDAALDKKQTLIHRIGEQQQLLATINQQLDHMP